MRLDMCVGMYVDMCVDMCVLYRLHSGSISAQVMLGVARQILEASEYADESRAADAVAQVTRILDSLIPPDSKCTIL